MSAMRWRSVVLGAVTLAACGSSGSANSAYRTPSACTLLVAQATHSGGGSLLFSELSVATVKVVYKSVRGLDSFLGSVTSRNIDTCTIENAVGRPCKNGEATYLVTPDGRHKFRVPCSFHLPFHVPTTRTT
jgi:hypothetical protein